MYRALCVLITLCFLTLCASVGDKRVQNHQILRLRLDGLDSIAVGAKKNGRDSSVGIATRYGLDGLGI